MQDHVQLGYLLERYGAFLTERQRSLMDRSVNDDLSLAEIAELEGISRQGVQDALRRGEQQLRQLEARLHLVERERRMGACIGRLEALAAGLDGLKRGELMDIIAQLRAIEEN